MKPTKNQLKLAKSQEKIEAELKKKVAEDARLLMALVSQCPPIEGLADVEGIKRNAMSLYNFGDGEGFLDDEVNTILGMCVATLEVLKAGALAAFAEGNPEDDTTWHPYTMIKVLTLLVSSQLYAQTENTEQKKHHIQVVTSQAISNMLVEEAVSQQKLLDTYVQAQEKQAGSSADSAESAGSADVSE